MAYLSNEAVSDTVEEKRKKIKEILIPGETLFFQNNAICFLPGNRDNILTAGKGFLGKLQDFFKRSGRAYYILLHMFSPVLSSFAYRKCLNRLLQTYKNEAVILNLGSGPNYLRKRKDVINVDIFAFDEVDLVADASNLHIGGGSVDFIINVAMMEHVAEPVSIVKEMHRVLRVGGQVFCYLPFMVPFHAAPGDFHRWTIPGSRELFSQFHSVDVFVGAGPTSGVLWVLQEWVSVLLSFGSKTLHDMIFIILMAVTWPIKLLDLFMVNMPYAEKIASGFCVVARK